MFSLFIATRWHCRLKGKHPFSEIRGRWETGKKNYSATLTLLIGPGDTRKPFFPPSLASSFGGMSTALAALSSWRASNDSASTNRFELLRAATSLSSGLRDVVERSELWERWWCHLTGAFVSARVFRSWRKLILSSPALPQPHCLCFCSDWDLDKLWALWKDGRQ